MSSAVFSGMGIEGAAGGFDGAPHGMAFDAAGSQYFCRVGVMQISCTSAVCGNW